MIKSLKKYRVLRKIRSYLPSSFSRYYKEYQKTRELLRQTEHLRPEELKEYQLKKLKFLINYCWENIEGYREYWEESNFHPEKVNSLEDLKKIPAISKDIIRENIKKFSNTKLKNLVFQTTGGSTGTPFGFYVEEKQELIEKAFIHDLWSRFYPSISLKTKSTILRGRMIPGNVYYDPLHGLILSSFNLTSENVKYFIRAIEKYKTPILQAYPSSLYFFCKMMGRNDLKLDHKFECIMLGSEKLYDFQKELIKGVFNAPICHWYGHAEKTVLAGNCLTDELFHVYPQYGITEIIKPKGEDADIGEKGEIVGTGFWNLATPFIRYKTMDFAEPGENRNKNCSIFYPVISNIEGRLQELIVGKSLNLISLTSLAPFCGRFSDIEQFKFYQREIGKIELYYIRTDKEKKVNEHKIISSLGSVLGKNFEVRIEEVNKIPPTKAGKHNFLEQKLDMQEFM
ncbi:MAG: phenylacetate--CoA ligase family protein [Bacteroidales bacterium]|nr:phenylacetate--CoA ligase family protein [Bacteroidales bacterium]